MPYVVAMPLGRLLTTATRPTRRDTAVAVCVTAAVALVAAVIVSNQYWGFYFRRPPLDERVARARQVHSVTSVGTEEAAGGASRFVAQPDFSLGKAIQLGREYSYDTPPYRSLVALADRRTLPGSPPTARAATLAVAYAVLEATGLLVAGDPGYPEAKHLGGILLEFEDDTGEALAFLGVRTGQVSNDHYAYYRGTARRK